MMVLSLNGISQSDTCDLRVYGRVMDAHDNSPLPYPMVQIKGTDIGTMGDSTGHYSLEGICPGEYTIVCKHLNCETVEENIHLSKSTHLDFYPEHHAEHLENVDVTGRVISHTLDISDKISGKELSKRQHESISKIVDSQPGVSMIQTGPDIQKPVIHGQYGNRISVIQNGHQIEDQQWGTEHAPMVTSLDADQVKIVKGSAGVLYGTNASGGAVVMEKKPLKNINDFSLKTLTSIQTNSPGVYQGVQLKGPAGINGFSYRLTGAVEKHADYTAPDYVLSNTGAEKISISPELGYHIHNFSANAGYSFQNQSMGILRAAHIGNITDFIKSFSLDKPAFEEEQSFDLDAPRQEVQHHNGWVSAQQVLPHVGKVEIDLNYQKNNRKEFDIRRGNRSNIPALNLDLDTYSSKAVFEHFTYKNLYGKMGVSYKFQENTNIPNTGVSPLLPNFRHYEPAIFLFEEWRKKNTTVDFGLRYQNNYTVAKRIISLDKLETLKYRFHSWALQTGYRHTFNDKITYTTNIGYTARAPQVIELLSEGLHHSAARIEEGNQSLTTENSIKWIQNLKINPKDHINIALSPYIHYYSTFINLEPMPLPRQTIRGAFPVFEYRQFPVIFYGTDISMVYRFSKSLEYAHSITLISAKNQDEDEYIYNLPQNSTQAQLSYILPDNKAFHSTELSISGQYFFKQNQVPGQPTIQQEDIPAAFDDKRQLQRYFDILYGSPRGYFLLTISIGTEVKINERNAFGIRLEASNILNNTFRNYLDQFRYYADAPGRNFELTINYNLN